ncbi:MAG: ABC transporter ATP-binding protein/permease [Eubacteriales bacterium]|nr:ABC transporter ATP-binding protein/permease [Eubacteriales bacterium]
MIEVTNANKFFNRGKRNRIHVIDHTSFTLEDSGLVAILGPSGCGKTTLLNCIGGLDRPDSGRIKINGKRINSIFSSHTDNIRNASIGYIFQNYHLMDDLSVFDNVALALKMMGVRKKAEISESVNYVLELTGMYRYRNRPAGMLSGGERQRVGIARALVKDPSIIIADEPTGNLDSKNTLEIMNIIKAISRDRLVILVTHESDLAKFYATRIIELRDGKVISDEPNERPEALDYRIDNRIYLKDMPTKKKFASNALNIEYYSDEDEGPVNIRLVVRRGNLYIESDKKMQPVEEDGAIELINDNYRAMSQEEADAKAFDFARVKLNKKRRRYHSIYNPFNILIEGFRKIASYKLIKKLLLAGFVAAAMFIMFALSRVAGAMQVKDSSFITADRSCIMVKSAQNTPALLSEYASLEGVDYLLPGNGKVSFTIDYSRYYYQTNGASDTLTGSMVASDRLTESDIICGRLPEDPYEIVVEKMLLERLIEDGQAAMVGILSPEDFIGKPAKLAQLEPFTIVGITDTGNPSVYMARDIFTVALMYGGAGNAGGDYTVYDGGGGQKLDESNTVEVKDISFYGKDYGLTVKEGRWPAYDYEVLVNYDTYWWDTDIGERIDGKVNGVQLVICGYYESKTGTNELFVTQHTAYLKYLYSTTDCVIYPTDEAQVLGWFAENNLNAYSIYQSDRDTYVSSQRELVRSTILISAIIILISLVEIYLMLRSSFLSRIREVGTLRAIGLKKKDIFRMFLGEILAITLSTSLVGFGIMGYVLRGLTGISFFRDQYVFDWRIVALSAVIVLIFNVFAGLLPVAGTLRKTPAAILARTDAD